MSCPICKRREVKAFKPFCSKRCADEDLGNWLTESYRIPVAPEELDTSSTEVDGEDDDGSTLH